MVGWLDDWMVQWFNGSMIEGLDGWMVGWPDVRNCAQLMQTVKLFKFCLYGTNYIEPIIV